MGLFLQRPDEVILVVWDFKRVVAREGVKVDSVVGRVVRRHDGRSTSLYETNRRESRVSQWGAPANEQWNHCE